MFDLKSDDPAYLPPLLDNYDRLAADAAAGKLVLFVGAGIMAPGPVVPDGVGKDWDGWLIPRWQDLLRAVLRDALLLNLGDRLQLDEIGHLAEVISGDSAVLSEYEQANLAKVLLGEQYLRVLHSRIYEHVARATVDRAAYRKAHYGFLHSVCELSKAPSVVAVVTYNFDNVPERIIGSGVAPGTDAPQPWPVWGARHTTPPPGVGRILPVYHVHGYLPQQTADWRADEAGLVFAQAEYFQGMMQPFSWQTSTHLHFLRSATCLFVGVSLRDMNMLRMLSYARQYVEQSSVYLLMAREELTEALRDKGAIGDEMVDRLVRAKATLFGELGGRLVTVDGYADLPARIDQLRSRLTPS